MLRRRLASSILGSRMIHRWLTVALLLTTLSPSLGRASSQLADPNGQWKLLSSPLPVGRRATGYCYDSLRKRLIVFGGFPVYLGDVWALDLATGIWTQLVPAGSPPPACYGP